MLGAESATMQQKLVSKARRSRAENRKEMPSKSTAFHTWQWWHTTSRI